tara:strand:+ start:29 stop:340 length:312 start_codon:yes stop_codon:yes gene_type:complete
MTIDRLDVMRKHSRDAPNVLDTHLNRKKTPLEQDKICIYQQLGLPKRLTQGYLIMALVSFISLGYQACNWLSNSNETTIIIQDKGTPAGVNYKPQDKKYLGGK